MALGIAQTIDDKGFENYLRYVKGFLMLLLESNLIVKNSSYC